MASTSCPEVITYSLNGKMVYVPPAQSYEVSCVLTTIRGFWFLFSRTSQQALDFAQKEFSADLHNIKRDRISFSVLVNAERAFRSVRIGAMAWPAVVSSLKRFEIIEVRVQPELYVEHVDGPPGYHIATGAEESKEAAEFYARSNSSRTPGMKSKNDKHPAGKGSKPFFRLK